jgi:hypothetical protein
MTARVSVLDNDQKTSVDVRKTEGKIEKGCGIGYALATESDFATFSEQPPTE